VLEDLSQRLTADFGKGFTTANLKYMRSLYLAFPIRHALRDEFAAVEKVNALRSGPDMAWCWGSGAMNRDVRYVPYLGAREQAPRARRSIRSGEVRSGQSEVRRSAQALAVGLRAHEARAALERTAESRLRALGSPRWLQYSGR
jgi:hypothetical protein